jgi:hypothetical protein
MQSTSEASAREPHVSRGEALRSLAFLTVLAALLVWGGRRVMPWESMFPDFICYASAGEILLMGQSPYDVELQVRIQQGHGWNRATDGFGIYDFLPFYYPPWFAFLWVLLKPLGYEGAKLVWFFLNVEFTLVTGLLLARTLGYGIGRIPFVLTPFFLFSVMAVLLGQTTMLVFFLIALAWMLLELRWDRSAGVALAWLTIKPQLTILLLLVLLLWLMRRRRFTALAAFAIMLALLCLVSTILLPGWLPAMLNAPRQTPSPTEHLPWIGNTWFLVLRSLGSSGPVLWLLYLAVALPLLVSIIQKAWFRQTALADLMAISLLAAFFVVPYARHYDFPVLLVPILVGLARFRPSPTRSFFVLLLLAVPWAQLYLLTRLKAVYAPENKFVLECSYFWLPVLCLLVWLFWIRPARDTPELAGLRFGSSG